MSDPKVFVLGLDCATPQLLFEQYRDQLPNVGRLMRQGAWGRLKSSDPPITVPAWTCMFSGRDAGELGLYGFRNRVDHSYDNLSIADSRSVTVKRAWDYASEAGLDVVVLGVPQTYPPSPVKGVMVSSFLTPSKESTFTYPALVKWELDRIAGKDGGYIIDVENFRTDDKPALLQAIHEMTERRFKVVQAWLDRRKWNLFCMVEMGPDRLHHGFWRFADPQHRLYERGNPHELALLNYYRVLDQKLGQLLETLPAEATLMVVSDHGARGMLGGVCINEYLIEQGLLTVRSYPEEGIVPLRPENIVWSETRVWAEGGYYGRVFLNVSGREPEGTITQDDYTAFRDRLAEELRAMQDPFGRCLGNVVHTPESLYRRVNGVPPDLLVYFGDLAWRSVGSIGHRSTFTCSNDTGPDDANHDHHGVFLARDKKLAGRGEITGLTLFDILPTILDRLDLDVPPDILGRILS